MPFLGRIKQKRNRGLGKNPMLSALKESQTISTAAVSEAGMEAWLVVLGEVGALSPEVFPWTEDRSLSQLSGSGKVRVCFKENLKDWGRFK